MTATLSDVRTDLRLRLGETTERRWTDDELDTWINEGCRDVARRSETIQTNHTSLLILPDVGKYDLPTDIIRIHRVEFVPTDSDHVYMVEASTYQQMDQLWGTNQTSARNYPWYYVLWGFPPKLVIQLYPVPGQAGSLNIYYYRVPAVLTADADVVEIPEGWHDLVVLYAEYTALRKDRDNRWQEAKTLYEDQLLYLMERTRQWHDQANAVIVGGNMVPDWLYGGGDY